MTRRQFLASATFASAGATISTSWPGLLAARRSKTDSVKTPALGKLPSENRTLLAAVEQAHAVLWNKFIDRNGIILDFVGDLPTPEDCSLGRPNALGWWSPIEDGPMFTGLYLPAACERACRSGDPIDKASARRLAQGLLKCASASDVPGFIARGFGTDGRCHYPLGSDDQTHPWFYGLFAYLQSGIPSAVERKQILHKMTDVTNALEATAWNCPGDCSFKGQFRGSFEGSTFRDASRYLFMLRGMYEATRNSVWLDRYRRALDECPTDSNHTRGEICAAGLDFDRIGLGVDSLWIYVGSQGALAKLAAWETNESIRARFRAGLASGVERVIAPSEECKKFDNNDTKVFGNADWRSGYPTWFPQKTPADAVRLSEMGDQKKLGERKTYENRYMRNPLAAAAIIALGGDSTGRDAVERAIRHYDYSKIYLSQFFFAECAYYALPGGTEGQR
jgi:hypothetical protein